MIALDRTRLIGRLSSSARMSRIAPAKSAAVLMLPGANPRKDAHDKVAHVDLAQ